eukprot:GFYU01034844.1.p1 GENE.GFYU01034844.1~~GFYU01034844.1.p1  ORF type:complete len:214 (+),score=65.47 GFYU01034844.1:2-643(+)
MEAAPQGDAPPTLTYVGVDPDSKPLGRWRSEWDQEKGDIDASKVDCQLEFHNGFFDTEFAKSKAGEFDFVFFLHCIHLFPAPVQAIVDARLVLNPKGVACVAIHVKEGVPELTERLFEGGTSYGQEYLTAEKLEERLKAEGMPVKTEILPSRVDVTEVLKKSDKGLGMYTFMLSMREPTDDRIAVLKEMSVEDPPQSDKWYLKEPVAIVTVTP